MQARSLRVRVLGVAVLAAVAAGCGNTPTTPSSYAPFSQTDIRIGTGAVAETGKTLTVNYSGWLYDSTKTDRKGAMFGTSMGSAGFQFTLGSGQVIAGWEQGVAGMQVGGLRQLVVPPSLAYGGTRNGPIPPNATLIFEIDLLSIAEETPATTSQQPAVGR
jgi:FKBP-type peptidyl-prolyl cis-trans isomerase FkpA